MSALTAPRDTKQALGDLVSLPVSSGAVVYAGGLAMVVPGGYAVPAVASVSSGSSSVAAGQVVGRAEHVASGGEMVQIRRGDFLYDNDATHPLAAGDIGKACYVVDDHTVAAEGVTVAGVFLGLADSQAVVRINP
ncbi:MAG: hypothetical protein IJQ73_17195 [Kiritimatiellae bacterium]|nr:hypothetical protein [Kiritimatiellia bacterium]